MQSAEASGKDVEEAVGKALAQLGVSREKVEIEILDDGDGLGNEARVRLTASGGDVVSEREAQSRLPADERDHGNEKEGA